MEKSKIPTREDYAKFMEVVYGRRNLTRAVEEIGSQKVCKILEELVRRK